MILGFSTQLNGKPTYFVERIWETILQKGIQIKMNDSLELGRTALPKNYTVGTHIPKLHTIRDDKKDRWQPGTKIDFFINCRQKNMFRFAPVLPVVSTQEVEIVYYSNRETIMNDLPPKCAIIIDGKKRLNDKEIEALSQNDGFDTVNDFFAYFENGFTGKIIHWTDKRY